MPEQAFDQAATAAVGLLAVLLVLRAAVRLLLLRGIPFVLAALGAVGPAVTCLAGRLSPRLGARLAALTVGLAVPAATLPAFSAPPGGVTHVVEHRRPAASPRTGSSPHRPAAAVVVRRGDTLWAIARSHLPRGAGAAAISREWPRWYALNKAVIGPDPGLIRPGTRLRVPHPRPTGTSSQHRQPSSPPHRVDPASLDPDRR
jgi:LysM domain